MLVNIAGLPKHAVLAALWNAAHRKSSLDFKVAMSESRARALTTIEQMMALPYFDWVDGRCLKVDIGTDEFDSDSYDRDNGGVGTAASVIENLRRNHKGDST